MVKTNKIINIHEAKTHLSRLLERVAAGEEIIIAKAGKPIAKLVSSGPPARRSLGLDRGRVMIAEDFGSPLPQDILTDFQR